MTTCMVLIASRRPDDLGPCVAYLVSQSNLALTGLATVATLGCLLVLAFMGLRELVRG